MMCNTQDVNLLESLVGLGRSDSANLDAVFELIAPLRTHDAGLHGVQQ